MFWMAISESLVTSVDTDVTEGKLSCWCGENECTYVRCKVSHKCSSCLLLLKSEALIAFIEEMWHILDIHVS